ncbi:hypothetical protein H1R20_g16175, partial [Candolleomyces eurysporus]
MFFDCSFNIGKHGTSQAPAATWGVLSYYNGTKANCVMIDQDQPPFLYAIIGSISRMPICTSLEEDSAIDRQDYDFIIKAEKLIPVAPLRDNSPCFVIEPNQALFITISGAANNCQHTAPFQFNFNIEVFCNKRSYLSQSRFPVSK